MAASDRPVRARGGCLCGKVTYQVRGPMRPIVACHCTECRRFTGGLWHATAAWRDDLEIRDGGTLKWYWTSGRLRRGFCGDCGAGLFADPNDRDFVSITAGSLEQPTGLTLVQHIFTDEAADYYRLDDQLPKLPAGGHEVTIPDD